MCDAPEMLKSLEKIEKLLTPRLPIDKTIVINDNQPWVMDYREYKHVFMWLPQALTLVMGEYGSGPVQAQVWINVGLRPGTKITTSGQATSVPIVLRFTDEVVP